MPRQPDRDRSFLPAVALLGFAVLLASCEAEAPPPPPRIPEPFHLNSYEQTSATRRPSRSGAPSTSRRPSRSMRRGGW